MFAKCAVLAAAMLVVASAGSTSLDTCLVKVEPIGCYKDQLNDRAMKDEILNARQEDRSVYAGYMVNWQKWTDYLPKFICHCAEIAFQKGYRVIGIQFYGECFSGMDAHLTYDKHGEGESCVHGETKDAWGKCTRDDRSCSGEARTNYVYRVAPTVCDTYYEPAGCHADRSQAPRPIPDLVMTERSYSSDKWNGHLIDWGKWNTYSPEMICRCAEKARKLGRKTFGVQFYGECWTGEESKINYTKDGPSSRCLAKGYKRCPYNSYHCVGQDSANSVYTITEIPLAARPWQNPKFGQQLALAR